MAVWVYLLFFKTNSGSNNTGASGTFTNLDLGDTTDPNLQNQNNDSNQNQQNSSEDEVLSERVGLHQLTTKHVAGYTEIQTNASATPIMYIVEQGVGHIYKIDLQSGAEERISATTFADTYTADISPNGKYVAIKTGYDQSPVVTFGLIDQESTAVQSRLENQNVVDFSFTKNNKLLYAVQRQHTIDVYSYDFVNDTNTNLFTIPFREASIVWGTTLNDTHYFYPKSAALLEGFVYAADSTTVRRIAIDGYGLSLAGNSTALIWSKKDREEYTSYKYFLDSSTELPLTVIPEKCTAVDTRLLCAADKDSQMNYTILDRWNKGLVDFTDTLYIIDGESVETLIDTEKETGRTVDVFKPEIGLHTNDWYFNNKVDQSLWMYAFPKNTGMDSASSSNQNII